MSAATGGSEGEQAQRGLFGEGEVTPGAVRTRPEQAGGPPRVMSPQRNQIELRPVDLESLLAHDHPARTVWAFVQSLDLAPLYARIKSVAGRGARVRHQAPQVVDSCSGGFKTATTAATSGRLGRVS